MTLTCIRVTVHRVWDDGKKKAAGNCSWTRLLAPYRVQQHMIKVQNVIVKDVKKHT